MRVVERCEKLVKACDFNYETYPNYITAGVWWYLLIIPSGLRLYKDNQEVRKGGAE